MRAALLLLAFAGAAAAQQDVAGTYEGHYFVEPEVMAQNPRPRVIQVRLRLERDAGPRLRGTFSYFGGRCAGDYPVTGAAKGNMVFLQKDPSVTPCGAPRFRFEVSGSDLVGTMAGNELRLAKK